MGYSLDDHDYSNREYDALLEENAKLRQQLAEQTSEPLYFVCDERTNWKMVSKKIYDETPPNRQWLLYETPLSVDVLVEALRPFAAFAEHYPIDAKYGNRPTSGAVFSVASKNEEVEITVEDFHRAKAALSSYKPTEG